MPNLIPLADVQEAVSRHASGVAKASLGRGPQLARLFFHGGEVLGAAWLASYANARFSQPGEDHLQVRGVPVDGVLGCAGILTGLLGWFGEMDMHAAFTGVGLLTSFMNRHASEMGMKHRIAREELSQQVASGGEPAPRQMGGAQQGGAQVIEGHFDAGPQNENMPRWARR